MDTIINKIKEDIQHYNIQYLRLQFSDLLGKTKNIEMPGVS